MSTDEMPPDIGFYFDAMAAPLDDASTQYNTDDRFQAIATLLATISAEWTGDDARTSSDLSTLGQTLADVQQSHPTDSNVASLEQLYVALQGVRSGPSSTPSKPPLAVPAPPTPPTAKSTVFDVAGMSAKSVATLGLAHPTAQTPPSWKLANLVDQNLITIKEVPYPACVPFNARIRNSTGKPYSRNGDFLQGITYGNPCRQRGSIAPGCVDPGGYGINVDSWLQSNVESRRWWDFANPGDPAACNGAGAWSVGGITYDYRGSIGNWSALPFSEMCRNFTGNLLAFVAQLQNPPPSIFGLAQSLFDTLIGASAGPHTTYGQVKPNSTKPTLTCMQLAAEQLTTIAKSLP